MKKIVQARTWVTLDSNSLIKITRKASVSEPIKQYMTNVLPDRRVWHKAIFGWVLEQGRGPDTPGSFKNSSGPVSIPLKRGASGDKPNPSKEG